jgi:hypothetical protein
MAKHLFQVVGIADGAAEGFGRADQIELSGKIAVGGDQIVAEQIDFLGDQAARFVKPAHREAKTIDSVLALDAKRVPMQGGANAANELIDDEWLGEEIDGPVPHGGDGGIDSGRTGDHDGAGKAVPLSQRREEFSAVAVGKMEIDDQQIDMLGLYGAKALREGGGGGDAAFDVAAEGLADEFDEIRLIIDNQDAWRSDL